MKTRSFIFLLTYSILIGCVSTKPDPNLPEWAKNRTSDPYYYIGIGYAPKDKHSNAYYEQASKAALTDLATEISVNVSGSILLVSVATDKQTSDDLSSIIQARVRQDIEGYEKVGSYENRQGCWIYYRLSKSQYAATQQSKEQIATDKAKAYYLTAVQAEENHNIKDAIIAYAKALDAIKAYFNDDITITHNGQNIKLIPTAHTKIYDLLNSIEITSLQNSIICTIGDDIEEKDLGCKVTMSGHPVGQFPIIINYSERAIGNANQVTNDKGEVCFSIHTIRSKKPLETVTFAIDKDAILLESAVDFSIRRWLSATPTHNETVEIVIQKPSIYIQSDEWNFDQPQTQNNLKTAFRTFLIQDGYMITLSPQDANCILTITTHTAKKGFGNGMFVASLNADISLLKNDKTLYNKTLSDINGTQLTLEKAGLEAYKAACRQVDIRLYRELQESFYKK